MTKTVYLAPLFGPGGVARYAQELTRELHDRVNEGDNSVDVCSASRRFPSRIKSGKGRLARYLAEQVVSPWGARSADGVQVFDHRPIVGSPKPFVLTVHDLFFLDKPEWFPRWVRQYKAAMLGLALRRRPRAIVCVSRYVRDRLAANHPEVERARLRVIYPGVAPPRRVDAPDDAGTYFLTTSVLEPKKNLETLLIAYRRARAHGLDLRWRIAGGHGYFGERIAKQLREEPGVELFGHAGPEQLERLYAGAVFVASPSALEGFGFPPLEAMRRGVPVVCSTGSAYDETVGDAALRCPPLEVSAWESALLRLRGDAALQDGLRSAGVARAAGFTWADSARRHLDLYAEVF